MLTRFLVLIAIIQVIQCQDEPVKRCARAASACLLAAEATEGPYYWNSTVRQDISEGKPGVPLRLSVKVLDVSSCSPISDALVDIWHCDGTGIYSHYLAASQGQMRGKTDNTTFFRGQQMTNSNGVATFTTIYPGWYPGRATHIHVRVHIGSSLTNVGGAVYAKGGHISHTGQVFFDDMQTDKVATVSPYSATTSRRVRNNEDGTYKDSNGGTMIVSIQSVQNDLTTGMTGEITVGVDPNATPAATGFDGRPPRPPPPPRF